MGRGPSILPIDWLRSPEDRKRRRVITVDLEDPRFDPVFAYANAVNPDRSVQESIRDLLLQAVSDEPQNAAIREAKLQAYREARARIMNDVSAFLGQLKLTLELEPAGTEPGLMPATHNAIVRDDDGDRNPFE